MAGPARILTVDWDKQDSFALATYQASGGYKALPKALKMQPQQIVDEVVKSNLRGRGGAGFPTGMKWNFVRKETSFPKYLTVNADEGEPGTFKDREILLRSPHMFVEGLVIGCYAIDCHLTYVYCRGEFRETAMKRVQTAIDEAYAEGFAGKNILGSGFDLEIRVVYGAGAYICGEETAMLESIEGRKGYPRLKPPFPANAGGGLFKQPTAVNNVETLANMPAIVNMGGEEYAKIGVPKNGGTRLFAISGHVKKPGVYEAPMGVTFRKLLDEYAGGMRDGSILKAIIPGGASSAIMTAEEVDWPNDFDTLKAKKTMAGSGAVVYLDQSVNMAHALANVMRFFAHESCGQCTPCREGTAWLSRLLDKIAQGRGERQDVDNVHQIARQMEMKTICALADGAAMPAKSYIEKFRADFDALVRE
ncbi:MAG: NADH-quinone oxidoreductase subunit NuoF [Deltaproteobacteria bacterium]|nr:MAG: NADH-quinone oxidoreductase subunit NuoF [Deltaproteobacteria bacterium]TMB35948.1 MAG: NADH-quinone oxidoreductase subunit NuoF [Deltaproteobacteria bacterium]